MKLKTLTRLGLLSALALIIFMVEAQIPAPVPVPGIKLGLANIVTIFAVWVMGAWQGVAVLAVRVFLGAVFSGNFSTIFYSAAGGALAILAAIGTGEQLIDTVIAKTGLPSGEILAAMTMLEVKGYVTTRPGGWVTSGKNH